MKFFNKVQATNNTKRIVSLMSARSSFYKALPNDFDITDLFENLVKMKETEISVEASPGIETSYKLTKEIEYCKKLEGNYTNLETFLKKYGTGTKGWMKTTITVTVFDDHNYELCKFSYSFYTKINKSNAYGAVTLIKFDYDRCDTCVGLTGEPDQEQTLSLLFLLALVNEKAELLAEKQESKIDNILSQMTPIS